MAGRDLKMFKELKNKIEGERNSTSVLWKTLVFMKDFTWNITHFFDLRKQKKYLNEVLSSRREQLEKNISSIWKYKSILYIGATVNSMAFGEDFRKNNYKIDVLKIFKPNVESLRKINWLNKVIEWDVRKVYKIINKKYDVVFWWHGPEHIPKKDSNKTLKKLKNKTRYLFVCECPWGKTSRNELYNNPWEKHVASLDRKDFEKEGFIVNRIGKKNIFGNNIPAGYRKYEK